FGDPADPFGVGHRGSAVLLHDERHYCPFPSRIRHHRGGLRSTTEYVCRRVAFTADQPGPAARAVGLHLRRSRPHGRSCVCVAINPPASTWRGASPKEGRKTNAISPARSSTPLQPPRSTAEIVA